MIIYPGSHLSANLLIVNPGTAVHFGPLGESIQSAVVNYMVGRLWLSAFAWWEGCQVPLVHTGRKLFFSTLQLCRSFSVLFSLVYISLLELVHVLTISTIFYISTMNPAFTAIEVHYIFLPICSKLGYVFKRCTYPGWVVAKR